MGMEPIPTVTLPGCYKATVNESETITEAQPLCSVRNRPNGHWAAGVGFPAAPHIERS